MKKILVVDDNKNNHILIDALLEEYINDNNEAIEVLKAYNGFEAVAIAKEKIPDIIFMDIMMPQMDGIEATKQIREFNKKAVIVAISAVDDAARQKEILAKGAEDYISKPINADVFLARVENYIRLALSRESVKLKSQNHANLYTAQIYSRAQFFYISSDDTLSEFWEYFLLDTDTNSEELCDATRTIYAIASIGLSLKLEMNIVIEESDKAMYMTLDGIKEIDDKFVKLVLIKNRVTTQHKHQDGKFCIELPHPKVEKKSVIAIEESVQEIKQPQQAPQQAVPVTQEKLELKTYNYMDADDFEDLREYTRSLGSLMLVVGADIEIHEVSDISEHIRQIAKITSIYSQSSAIGQTLGYLSRIVDEHKEAFAKNAENLAPMCAAFARDLNRWIEVIFFEGATSANYMDDTIISNAQTISSMLTYDDSHEADGDLDDIFNF